MNRHFTPLRLFCRFFISLLLVGFFAWLFGYFYPVLLFYLLGLVLWNYAYQLKLSRWLWQSRTLQPPQAPGTWSDIYDGIYHSLKRSQVRRRSLVALLQRFREAAETIPDAALVIEENGGLVWSNKLAQSYLGLHWPADKGIRITNLIRHPRFIKYFHQQDFHEAITLNFAVGQKVRDIELRMMPYASAQLLVIARDVTRVRELERMRKDFVANASHELKTPLTVMQGYLELMAEPLPAEQMTKALQSVSEQTQRMQKLVEQLLVLSRMESSRPEESSKELVPMGAMLLALLDELKLLAKTQQVEIKTDIDLSLKVQGHTDKLRAASYNLLVNALQHAGVGTVITVVWRQQQGQAYFAVIDTGRGIAAEHVKRLTERFYRVGADRNSRTGGTGLGLAIVKHALEAHQSSLQISSQVGQGSCFSFYLPLSARPSL